MSLALVPEIVEPFDEVEARQCLADVDRLMSQWVQDGVALADAIHRSQRAQPWKVDDDFRAALAADRCAIAQRGDGSDDYQGTWLRWKFNRSARYCYDLARYGQLRAILAADPTVPALAEPEGVARPLGKLLAPKYRGKEQRDDEARDEAIREAWRRAVDLADGRPSDAVGMIHKALAKSEFPPFRRMVYKSPGQRAEERARKIETATAQFRAKGQTLINLGAVDRFDEIAAELAEMRARWKPT